jgi:hypothetical protein
MIQASIRLFGDLTACCRNDPAENWSILLKTIRAFHPGQRNRRA